MSPTIVRFQRIAAWLAPALWLVALVACGLQLEGYSHLQHPVALLGAAGVPGAGAFNLLGFVIPGLLVAVAAIALRGRLVGARWPKRIGARVLMLSGLAFALQGALPLDPSDLDADASRMHAASWVLWWVAMFPALVLLAIRERMLTLVLVIGAAAFALATLLATPAIGQRVATLVWFAFGVAALRLPRDPAA